MKYILLLLFLLAPTILIWTVQANESLVQYAWKISSWDMAFVSTMYAESSFNYKAVWRNYKNWKLVSTDHWVCQWNSRSNGQTIKNKNFKDPYWQVDECYRKWKLVPNKWRYWYAYKKRGKYVKKIETIILLANKSNGSKVRESI